MTDARKNTGKNIMAWATSRPVITLDWVATLMERKHGTDPIPSEHEYLPPGTLATDDVNDTLPRNKTLENIYLITLFSEELEELAISGGGKVKSDEE